MRRLRVIMDVVDWEAEMVERITGWYKQIQGFYCFHFNGRAAQMVRCFNRDPLLIFVHDAVSAQDLSLLEYKGCLKLSEYQVFKILFHKKLPCKEEGRIDLQKVVSSEVTILIDYKRFLFTRVALNEAFVKQVNTAYKFHLLYYRTCRKAESWFQILCLSFLILQKIELKSMCLFLDLSGIICMLNAEFCAKCSVFLLVALMFEINGKIMSWAVWFCASWISFLHQ